jgi:hypothetical protein
MGGVVSAYQMSDFSVQIDYPNQYKRTGSLKKTDASSGSVYYGSGGATYICVEMWGSDGKSGDYRNFTYPHTEQGASGATYYKVNKGEYRLILNTIYEYYEHECYASLYVQSSSMGTTSGSWSSMTD